MSGIRIFLFFALTVMYLVICPFCEPAAIPDICANIPDEDRASIPGCATPDPERDSPSTDDTSVIDMDEAKEMCPSCVLTDASKLIGTTNSQMYEGDIAGVDLSSLGDENALTAQANAILDETKHWPNAVVPYTIGNLFRKQDQLIIKDAMDVFHKETCVKFKPRTDEPNFIHLFPGFGCSSFSGRLGTGKQGVSLQMNGCMKSGTIQHELMHTLGFYHEQSRSDRDEYVDINFDNIAPNDKLQFKSYPATEVTAFNEPYDFGSVLHYGRFDFAKNPKIWTIQPKEKYSDQTDKMGQRERLSAIDIRKINIMYKCPSACSSKPGWSEYKGKCYFFSSKASESKKTFVQARNFCNKLGATIASPSESVITEFIIPQLKAASIDTSEDVWLSQCQAINLDEPEIHGASSCDTLSHFFCHKSVGTKKSPI